MHAVELQHGADLRLFQLVARKQPYLLSLSVQSIGRHCDSFMYQLECMNVDVTSTVYIFLLIRTSFLY